MTKAILIVSGCLLMLFALLTVVFRCLGKKVKFLLPQFFKIPKDEHELYKLDVLMIEASDMCISWFFYVLICAALSIGSPISAILLYIVFFAWFIRIFTMDPRELYMDYKKFDCWLTFTNEQQFE